MRQAFVERGLEAALLRKKPTGRQYRKLDGAQEARLIALACGAPPEGRSRWTLRLLADRLVERIAASAAVFEHKWRHRLPLATPCFAIRQPGDTLAFMEWARRLPALPPGA